MNDNQLHHLPAAEDDRHEYKSSLTKDSELSDKVAKAASGFWNSGGGLFVIGVDGNGKTDGGITKTVSRQSRRDWIDQAILRVTPLASYSIDFAESSSETPSISPGNVVVLIRFAVSETGPHMAHDNRYYIRVGAHTLPASHFLVEAIHARRGLRAPFLRHVVRRKPESSGVLQIGILCLNNAPALDVEFRLEPIPRWMAHTRFPLTVPVISNENPYYLDFHILTMNDIGFGVFTIIINYSDMSGRKFSTSLAVDADKQLGPNLGIGGINEMRGVEQSINAIAEAIKHKR